MKSWRKVIRRLHHEVDGFLGRIFSHHEPVKYDTKAHERVNYFANFHSFSYSKLSHFEKFHPMPIHVGQSPATCDLKVYQDLFIHSYIKDNLSPGSQILEIGGGESRVIACLKNEFKFWNLDKLEGVGFGPKQLWETGDFILVKDNIGEFSPLLSNEQFDLVFSISTVEHFLQDEKSIGKILADVQRILKPGGISIHCVDALLFEDHLIVHPLVRQLLSEIDGAQSYLDHTNIKNDPDLWCLSPYAYYTRWYHLTKKSMIAFGKPFSINLIWQKDVYRK